MVKIIGIDLGTSNSAAAVMMGGKPTIIPSAEGVSVGGKSFPSFVAFTKDGEKLVGEPARRQAVSNPQGTIFSIKRKMGTTEKLKIHGKEYTPQQISSFILQKIKTDAEAFLGEKIEKAVITVPAYFNDNQRQATKDAGTIAGLEVVRIINEPTAAALAYGIDRAEKDQNIMVFDFGGGTLDVTIMEFGEGVFEVKSTSGDTTLGGTDMDKRITDYIMQEFKDETRIDLNGSTTPENIQAVQRIREAVEKAKIELSTTLETEINLPFIASDSTGPKHLSKKLTRAKMEDIIRSIVDKCEPPMLKAIEDAELQKNQINRIVLVGGPTRMPIVRKFVEKVIAKNPERGVDPMECVAIGASVQGAVLTGEVKDILLLDVTPLSLGVEVLGGICNKMIERNTTIPTKKTQIYSTAADSQTVVTIHILQGEREMSSDNVSLGQFNLEGIPSAPRGIPQIEVTFDIDANGIVNVTAKDKATGKENSITVTGSTNLSSADINRMAKEGEQYAEEDKKKKEEQEIRNNADTTIYTGERTKSELQNKLTEEKKQELDVAIKELRDVLEQQDVSIIKEKTEKLNKTIQEIGASLYQQTSEQQANTENQDQENKERVVQGDAEVINENDKEKNDD